MLVRWSLDAYYCLRRSITANDVKSEAPPGLRFGRLNLETDHDLAALLAAWPLAWSRSRNNASLERDFRAWLASGDDCFAFWSADRVVAASWVGYPGSPFLKGFAPAYPLREGEVLRRTVFVDPEFRGSHLQNFLGMQIDRYLFEEKGILHNIAYVGINNVASAINALRRYDTVSVVYHVEFEVLGRKWNWFPKLRHQRWLSCQPTK